MKKITGTQCKWSYEHGIIIISKILTHTNNNNTFESYEFSSAARAIKQPALLYIIQVHNNTGNAVVIGILNNNIIFIFYTGVLVEKL